MSDISYNAAGQLTRIAYGNGTVTDYSYNPQTLRLDQLVTTGPAGTLQDFSYAFDPVGNVTAITDRVHTGTQSFQYDPLDRLTQAVGSYGTLTYAYDALGNMTEKEGVQMTYGAGPAGPHAVTSVGSGFGVGGSGLTLTYDASGNLMEKRSAACSGSNVSCLMSQVFAYDAENRLVEVATAPETTVSVTFQPGWNFFSLSVIPEDASVAALFPSFSADFEQIAQPASSLEPPASSDWEHYVGNATFDDFDTLEYGEGYQVYCKASSPVTIAFTARIPVPYYYFLLALRQLL